MEKQKIGFLGPVGTFGHEAVRVWDSNATHVPFRSHLHILESVERGEVAEGVVAIENSIDGTVNDVLDYFIHEAERTRICGEIVVPINQCLFARSGVSLKDVQMVISHPKGLGQCAKNIFHQFPEAQQVTVDSTAAAVVRMLAVDVPAVAIAGKTAMQPGAVIIRENFQDIERNDTRFWVVGRKKTRPTGKDRTSLAFETFANVPGALLSICAIFASRGLNLSKIESRPTKRALGEYVFLVDVEAHQADPSLREALKMVRVCTPRLRVFGSYPRWQNGF